MTPGRVYRRKEYGAIDRMNHCVALWGTDVVYSGSDCGSTEHLLSLLLRLVLIIDWASQYIVDGRGGALMDAQ